MLVSWKEHFLLISMICNSRLGLLVLSLLICTGCWSERNLFEAFSFNLGEAVLLSFCFNGYCCCVVFPHVDFFSRLMNNQDHSSERKYFISNHCDVGNPSNNNNYDKDDSTTTRPSDDDDYADCIDGNRDDIHIANTETMMTKNTIIVMTTETRRVLLQYLCYR